jgi:hypothetical protein
LRGEKKKGEAAYTVYPNFSDEVITEFKGS